MDNANGSAFSEDLIRAELARVLESSIFALSERLGRFLRFAVEHAISGSEDGLKEYVIGTEVYDRKPPYHPTMDSIVRTEARRLRIKLKEYYESEGKDNPLCIYFRPGSYIPVFRPKAAAAGQGIAPGSAEEQVFVEGAGIPVAVIPFLDASGQPLSSEFARGVTDELVHDLMHCEGSVLSRQARLRNWVHRLKTFHHWRRGSEFKLSSRGPYALREPGFALLREW